MSDTDKTKPFWVQLYQNPQWREERHDHRKGECNLVDPIIPQQCDWAPIGCCYWASDEGNQHVWRRNSRIEHIYRNEANGAVRTGLRNLLSEIRKMSREDLEDVTFAKRDHKHGVLWDLH